MACVMTTTRESQASHSNHRIAQRFCQPIGSQFDQECELTGWQSHERADAETNAQLVGAETSRTWSKGGGRIAETERVGA